MLAELVIDHISKAHITTAELWIAGVIDLGSYVALELAKKIDELTHRQSNLVAELVVTDLMLVDEATNLGDIVRG